MKVGSLLDLLGESTDQKYYERIFVLSPLSNVGDQTANPFLFAIAMKLFRDYIATVVLGGILTTGCISSVSAEENPLMLKACLNHADTELLARFKVICVNDAKTIQNFVHDPSSIVFQPGVTFVRRELR